MVFLRIREQRQTHAPKFIARIPRGFPSQLPASCHSRALMCKLLPLRVVYTHNHTHTQSSRHIAVFLIRANNVPHLSCGVLVRRALSGYVLTELLPRTLEGVALWPSMVDTFRLCADAIALSVISELCVAIEKTENVLLSRSRRLLEVSWLSSSSCSNASVNGSSTGSIFLGVADDISHCCTKACSPSSHIVVFAVPGGIAFWRFLFCTWSCSSRLILRRHMGFVVELSGVLVVSVLLWRQPIVNADGWPRAHK